MPRILKHAVLPVLLLPLFFVLNGYRDNYPLVSISGGLIILLRYLFFSFLFFGIAWLIYRNANKAALAATAIMCIQFFFGSIHDSIKSALGDSFLTKYSFLLSFFAGGLLVFLFLLKKKRTQPNRFGQYLNLLLTLLILLDVIVLLFTAGRINNEKILKGEVSLTNCRDCPRPDIYFIIADGYPGEEVLDSIFNFRNTAFTDALRQRGFHITPRSRSNYNFTMFSMASMMNMDYLEGMAGDYREQDDIRRCFRAIRENRLLKFLTDHGYRFHNHSLFDFAGHSSPAGETFIPRAQQLITSQTLTRRIERDLAFHVFSSPRLAARGKEIMYRHDRNNKKMVALTLQQAQSSDTAPKFTYTHLLMPHFPYYYDSMGRPYDWQTVLHFNHDKKRYLEYLKYSNGVFLSLIDSIIASSDRPPLIIFGSDHGFRQFTENVTTDILCTNFNAVLLPGRNYSGFYPGMSSVNNFRVILNTAFNQKLPMLKDSTNFIIDSEVEKLH